MATVPALMAALEASSQRARDLERPLDALGAALLTAAAPRAPRGKTGLLAGSVRARATAGSLTLTSTADYFAPVHNGRKRRGRVKARPWILDTITDTTRQGLPTIEAYVLEPLERL